MIHNTVVSIVVPPHQSAIQIDGDPEVTVDVRA